VIGAEKGEGYLCFMDCLNNNGEGEKGVSGLTRPCHGARFGSSNCYSRFPRGRWVHPSLAFRLNFRPTALFLHEDIVSSLGGGMGAIRANIFK
jgi:hypothetical protein